MSWTIDFYKTKSGRNPVKEFLDSLSSRQVANIIEAMDLLKTFGLQLKEPYVKFVGDKLYELRVKDPDGIYRILYFAASGKKFVVVHGFRKKTQKIPAKELAIAKKRMKEYLNG
jgi:phage-related protein